MNQANYVIFKGTRDGINILFDSSAPFALLCEQLEEKVEKAAKFFDNATTSIAFSGRSFSEQEEAKLLELITAHTNMDISFVKTETDSMADSRKKITLTKAADPFTETKFHKGSLRNGQSVESEGSVVIVGDVNPGAEVRAGGNIIILGQLKGMAHAGCKGSHEAFVSAVYMAPVQLRIADIITLFPEENKKGPKPPEYAFVQDGQICVMPLS